MELWLNLMWNSFTAHVLLSPNSDTVLNGFAVFQRPDWMQALVVATFAGTLANFASYVLGVYLSTFRNKPWFSLDDIQYAAIQRIMRRYGVFMLLIPGFPVYSLLVLATGLFRVKPWHVVALTAAGLALHHYLNMQELMAAMR